ncbi:hypothetical protein [Algoriphagus pacificus]|uniref:VCBS repeat-containing protein n=1 Tax=Algoriphagus pacificus TaxID=2811234 RepID=A0ABS3CG71_9BACT|nr:hypothetical protein [Algoriphagus pacificus]MBN7815519.1 hypothetical protein [Algoriphagus pacificus]
MNKFLKLLVLLQLTTFGSYAQEIEVSEFIPEGYLATEKHFGDLNKDGQDDCVLIIKKTDKNNVVINQYDKKVDRNRRGIIVLFKNENGYQLADKNYNCFSSENEDGRGYIPPDLVIQIKNEKLYVHYGHGRYGYWDYTFRFQNSNFELIGYDQTDMGGPSIIQQISLNFLSKKKLVRKNTYQSKNGGDIKEVFDEKWTDIKVEALIKLSEIDDFDKLVLDNY